MSMHRTPLDLAGLSTAAQRALGPGPGRMMAARGMMPLSPVDQLSVLYQLALDADATTAAAARTTAAALPERLLAGTLADPTLDPRILDFLGDHVVGKPAAFEALALNPTAGDQTLATLAARGTAGEVDLIAQNEQRLLRHPEIIAAMYMNRNARMSTIDRIVELAVRNQVRVPGLAAWDEVARALSGAAPTAPEDDELFARAAHVLSGDDSVLTNGDAEQVLAEDALDPTEGVAPAIEQDIPISRMTMPQKIRLAQLGNAFARATLIRDPVRLVAVAAIKSPGVTDIEAARYAGNQALAEDVIRYIATRREWTKMYGVKVSLCRNAKTPVAEAARLLPFLREKDLVNLSKSRGVSSALIAQARKLMMQRRGPGK